MIKGNKKNNYRKIFDSAVSTSAFRNKTYQGEKMLTLLLINAFLKQQNDNDIITPWRSPFNESEKSFLIN